MLLMMFLLAVFLSACGPVGEMIQNAGQPTTTTVSTTDRSIDQYQLEAYNGPKARVAVSRFEDQTAKGRGVVYGGYPGLQWYTPQIGSGMADMLTDALLQSNRFIVLDRQTVKDVIQEQDLAASGRVSKATGAPIGQIEGAELLVKGSVTEFEPGAAGAGAGAGLGVFGLPGALIGGLAGSVRQSHVAMIIQVVDARTTRILFSTTVEGKANDFNLGGFLGGFGGGGGGFGGLGSWQKTPVEKAIRMAILQAVKELSTRTPPNYFHYGSDTGVTSASVNTPSPSRDPKPAVITRPQQSGSSDSVVLDSQRIRQAQEMLKQAGYDPGPIDGATGAKTRAATAQFQTSRMNLKDASGRLDEPTFAALKSAVAEKSAAPQPASSQKAASATATGDMPSNVYVNVSRASLLDSPSAGAKSVATVTQGAKLTVQADDKESYFIVTDDGLKGWINKALTRR